MDPLAAASERIVNVTPALLESRRRRCEAFLRRCARHAELGRLLDLECFLTRPDYLVALALERPEVKGNMHAAAGPPALPRVLSLEEVASVSDDMAIRFQKHLGLLPSIPERPFEDAAWGATQAYLRGLGEHVKRLAAPLQAVARIRSQLQRELEKLAGAFDDLAAYEADAGAAAAASAPGAPAEGAPGPPARPHEAALRRAAACTRAEGRAELQEAMEGEAALADALADFEGVDAFFREAERERQRRLLRIERLDVPLRQDKKRLSAMTESGHWSLIESMSDRLASYTLHGVAVQERRALREARLKSEIARLEGQEEAAMLSYDAYCDRLRGEVKGFQDSVAREMREAFAQYAALKHAAARSLADAWEQPV
eukprot:tig00021537_g22262.t1